MISPKLFRFIERVVAAEMDIVVQNGQRLPGRDWSTATTEME